jgi:quercetin dioxygenase-like cupin family protein
MQRLVILGLGLGLSAFVAAAPAQSKTLKWGAAPPSLPSGAQMAVVSGNPGAKGRFVIQLKMPADYAVGPHSHPTDEMVKVLSGKLHYAMADKQDMAKAKTLTAGHSVTMTAKMNHWVHAPAPATIQVSGRGPFEITYVDPKDDPRTK